MFSMVVRMYRALGRPDVVGDVFEYEGHATPETVEQINQVNELPQHFGFFQRRNVIGDQVDIEFSLAATREYGRFHNNVAAFIAATPSLAWGNPPEEYYICDIDFYSYDDKVPEIVQRMRDACEFIRLLAKLASDNASEESKSSVNRLIFVLAADGKSPAKTLALLPRIRENLLAKRIPHLNHLRALMSEDRKNQIHVEERRSIMRLTIADSIDTFGDEANVFDSLIMKWDEVLTKYRYNVLAFLHQFSFEKVRKEIATAQIEYATKLSAVLGDVAGKLLALPLSFAGLLLLRNASALDEFVIYTLGLVVITVVLLGILINQWIQTQRLGDSFQIVFSQYDDKLPTKLHVPIAKAKSALGIQQRVLRWTFIIFAIVATIPLLGAAWYAAIKFGVGPLTFFFSTKTTDYF